jgi:hypothetical protein
MQSLPGSQTGRTPAPTLPWGQWASLRYTSFAGGGAVVDSKNIVCHVNSSACRVYVTSLYSTTSISFYKSFYTLRVFIYFLQLHFRGHFRTEKSLFYVYTHLRTLICGCTVVSTVLQLHFRGNFRVHYVHPRLHSSVDAQ